MTDATQPDPIDPAAWQRAVALATREPDAAEALAGILAELGPRVGADAAMVVERADPACRGVWGCAEGDVAPLLCPGGPVRSALDRQEEWVDAPLVVERGQATGDGWPVGVERLLLVSLRVRGQPIGALVLLHRRGGTEAPGGALATVATFAGLAGLVLENDRLYDEARAALQARDHFLTALNHELRTPATALLLEADMLRAHAFGTLPTRLAQAVARTEAHVHELMGALRRVLDLGSLQDEASPEGLEVIQPRQTVAALLRRIEPAAKRKDLTLSLYTPRNLPPLQTDVHRVSRILLHLLSNAIKYTANGGVEVRLMRTLRTLTRFKQEPVLMIHIRDTGRGIPPEELERIFEPFTQVEEGARTDSRTRGLGLGLPLARQLARSLGGEVLIESAPRAGTTASLILPYQPRQPSG